MQAQPKCLAKAILLLYLTSLLHLLPALSLYLLGGQSVCSDTNQPHT